MTAKQSDSDVNSREYWQRAISNPKEYGLSETQVQVMSESLTLTDPEYWQMVLAKPSAHGFTAAQAKYLAKKTTKTLAERIDEENQMTPEERLEAKAGAHIGFYEDEHVQLWLAMGTVSPKEAALLFFGRNPFEFKDRLPFMGDKFDSMQRTFEDIASDGLTRNLRDWLFVARARNLHGVAIDGWEACITVSARDTSEQSEAMHPTAPVMNAPENRYWRDLGSEIWAMESKIEEWAKKDRSIPSEALIWESTRAALDDRLSKLEELWKLPPFLVTDWKALTDADLENAIRNAAQADVKSQEEPVTEKIDFSMLATRQQLIDAFGAFTGMNMTWFDNLNDTPKLKAARKFTGQGGRQSAEPLFCPYEVMQWLADPKRKKGKPLSRETAWRLLKSNFGKVYNPYSIGDPNSD